jgi:hypothetical protein
MFYTDSVRMLGATRTLAARFASPRRRYRRHRPVIQHDELVIGPVLVLSGRQAPSLQAPATHDIATCDAVTDDGGGPSPLPVKARRFVPSRRGEEWQGPSCDILTRMAPTGSADYASSDASAAPTDGISAFVARVLDQLSLSAWFPAAFLTAGVALLLEFRTSGSASISNAVTELAKHPLPELIMMVPLLVIATLVTQAFSFEAIRFLEGYWGWRWMSLATRALVRRHVHRKKAIYERAKKDSIKAFNRALPDIIRDSPEGLTGPVVMAVEAQLSHSPVPSLEGREAQAYVRTIHTWKDRADAWRLEKVERLVAEYELYPDDSRIRPTKLGNVLRATEDELNHAGDDVQRFAFRYRERVSPRVQLQHDQYRTRLDMYCTLVFVSLFLVALTPATLVGHVSILPTVITMGSFSLIAVVSYLAAISSAKAYCTILKEMDEAANTPVKT